MRFFIIICILVSTLASFAQKKPLEVPSLFNPELNLVGSNIQGEIFHMVYFNAQFVEKLLDNGTSSDIELAEKIIPSLLSCQELNPSSPNYGGFRWEFETPLVNDLNAVEFLLDGLVPMMIRSEHKLSSPIRSQLRESIRLALGNVDRVDVAFNYTNIILKDITNSCLGGELLKDTAIANRGYRRFREWIAYTDANGGGVYEFNALPYTAVAMDVLSKLSKLVKDEETRVLAKIMLARLSLSAGLHIHPTTGRWAGPHGRAYHASYISEGGWYKLKEKEMETMNDWVDEGKLPDWMNGLMKPEVIPDEIVETISRDHGMYISTYKTPSYAFGVASRNMSDQDNRFIAWQSNVFSMVFDKPGEELPGIVYSRYINNDEWLGDFSAAPGRPTNMLIPDKGNFQGVQNGNRAIGLYAPRHLNAMEHYSSAKSVIALPRWKSETDKIWVNEKLIKNYPALVPVDGVVVIESGSVMIGIKPFQLGNLGYGSHMEIRHLDDKDKTLVFEMYNYQGPAKTFWELAWPGAFFQGYPANGWYTEVVEGDEYENGAEFAKTLKRGKVIDDLTAPFTYTGGEERLWEVEYARDGKALGMEVDMFNWFASGRRWNEDGEIVFEMLSSRYARQTMNGKIEIEDVTLECGKQSAWLYQSPDKKTIVAAYHGPEEAPFVLKTAEGNIKIQSVSSALVVIRNGKARIDALSMEGKPSSKGIKILKSEIR